METLLYRKLAKYYDLTYRIRKKDYPGEARFIRKLVRKYGRSKGRTLLDVACGTGEHLKFLRKDFRVAGLDYSKDMLRIARRKLRGVRFVQGDMRNFKLGKFDAITCMFSAINYMTTRRDLERVFRSFYNNLEEGGVAIIEALTRDVWYDNRKPMIDTVKIKDIDYVRASTSIRKGDIATLHFTYLIKEKGRILTGLESHKLGIFWMKDLASIARKAGFSFVKTGLGKDAPWHRPYLLLRK